MKVVAVIALAAALLLLGSCADPAEKFVEGRLQAECDGAWPVCTTTAGCILGNTSYLSGHFPGVRRFSVRTDGEAEITVSLFLVSQQATGQETRVEWNEAGCGSRAQEAVEGRVFFKEATELGEFQRVKPVYKPGDHLIAVESDSAAEYLLKVDVRER